MRSSRQTRSTLWALLVAVLLLTLPTGGPADAQEDCESWCIDGYFDYVYLKCVPTSWAIDCTHCQVTCPGGGGGGWEPENQG